MTDNTLYEKPSRIYVREPLTGPLPPGWEDVHVCVIGNPEPPVRSDFWPMLRRAIRAILRR
jgi:hypothetical protein